MPNRRQFLGAALALPALAIAGPAAAGASPVFAPGGLALGGTDPVAYFTEGRAVEGSRGHGVIWRKAVWLFSSAETMTAFEMDPRRFAPRFGGYCALHVARGQLAASVPEAFAIHGGALYLAASVGDLAQWHDNAATMIHAAEANWPAVLG
jgi:hypothetical protein